MTSLTKLKLGLVYSLRNEGGSYWTGEGAVQERGSARAITITEVLNEGNWVVHNYFKNLVAQKSRD